MDEKTITNYIATLVTHASNRSFKDIVEICDNTLNGQEHFFTKKGYQDIQYKFSPERFIASNTKHIFSSEYTEIILNEKNNTPQEVIYTFNDTRYRLINEGVFGENESVVATQLFLDICKVSRPGANFNFSAYYTLYKEYIDLIKTDESLEKKTCKFYIEYGFWNSLFLKPIDGLLYIASNHDLIEEYRVNEHKALTHYFETGMNEGRTISFHPAIYIASNIDKLKEFVTRDGILEKQATKHYILSGYLLGYNHNSFDHFSYLANNPYRIRKLLLCDNGKIIWDYKKLIKSVVAKDYIVYHSSARRRMFDPHLFIRRYVSDTNVNFDGNLCLNNACEYFVISFVKYKYIRKSLTVINMLKAFMNRKFEDALRQTPFNVTNLVIQNKFL